MLHINKHDGFTLSELLLSLTIVGVIAVLTVPVMMNNVQNRMFATQVKNMSAMIEQLAQDQLLVHRTRDLSDTDFADPEELLSDKHFAITKTCSASTALRDCWKTAATGKDKVTYMSISKIVNNPGAGVTVVLKNGVILRYIAYSSNNNFVGSFLLDINGNDKPNISGRDYFGFYITHKGVITDGLSDKTLAQKLNDCKTLGNSTAYYCYAALVGSGWKMDY